MLNLFRVIQRRWSVVVALTLLGGGLAALAATVLPRTYAARADGYLSFVNAQAGGPLAQRGEYLQNHVASYVMLADSPVVLQRVIAEQRLRESVADLAGRVSAASPAGTVVLRVTVRGRDAGQAARIANSVLAHLGGAIAHFEGGTASPVKLTATTPAVAPRTAVSPRIVPVMLLGVLGGALVGVLAALGAPREARRVKDGDELESIVDAPLLGEVDRVASRTAHALFSPLYPPAYSYLPVWAGVQERANDGVLLVTSAAAGDGRTTTALQIASAAAVDGYRVLLVDAAGQGGELSARFELDDIGSGWERLLAGRSTLDMVIHEVVLGGDSQGWIIPAGSPAPLPPGLHRTDAVAKTFERIKVRFDLVVIDSAASVDTPDNASLVRHSDSLLVVARSGSDARVLRRFVQRLALFGAKADGCVLTFATTSGKVEADDYADLDLMG